MKADQLHDAFGELPEEMIASVAGLRGRKKVNWIPWAVTAACACLVFALGWQHLPELQAKSTAENGKADAFAPPLADSLYSQEDSMTAEAELILQVVVTELEKDGILVSVLPEQKIAEGTVIRIPVPAQQESYAVGDCLKLYCDGQLKETWPLQLGQLFGIERIELP